MRTKLAMFVLGFLAMLAPVADLTGATALKGIAAATSASPAMKVFTSHDGYETFSPKFHIEWSERGAARALTLTPAVYAKLRGPYNRRNAYGAVLSYSPVLSANPVTRDMHAAATRFALCGDAPVLAELGIDVSAIDGPVTVRIEPRRPIAARWQLAFAVTCDD